MFYIKFGDSIDEILKNYYDLNYYTKLKRGVVNNVDCSNVNKLMKQVRQRGKGGDLIWSSSFH